ILVSMLTQIRRFLAVLFLSSSVGVVSACHSNRPDQSDTVSRAYKLRHPDVDVRLIGDVLEKERREHNVRSSTERTKDGYLIVKTTPKVHSKIRSALEDVEKQE